MRRPSTRGSPPSSRASGPRSAGCARPSSSWSSGPDQGEEVEISKPRVHRRAQHHQRPGPRRTRRSRALTSRSRRATTATACAISTRATASSSASSGSARCTCGPGTTFRIGHTEHPVPADRRTSSRSSCRKKDRFDAVIGASAAMREIFAHAREGRAERAHRPHHRRDRHRQGDGRARASTTRRARKTKPFVVLDCGAIPRDLIESSSSATRRARFTGAVGQHRGCFEQANGGTIFLDEIGELASTLQPKLLRVLEQREIKRVGGDQHGQGRRARARRDQPRPARRGQRRARSARTSTSGSRSSTSSCRRCASAARTSRRWSSTSCARSRRGAG